MYLCNETKENKHKVQEIKCLRKPESDKLAGRGGCLASASGSFSNYELYLFRQGIVSGIFLFVKCNISCFCWMVYN